jgi:hypothetical protein
MESDEAVGKFPGTVGSLTERSGWPDLWVGRP